MARLGVFGGTFDPPHIGHLVLAEEARADLGLARVLWVLTPDPPHKQGVTLSHLEIRQRMVEECIRGNGGFAFSRVDLDRPGPHFMVDTLGLLQGDNPRDELVLVLGGDSLRDLPTWGRPLELIGMCSLVVMDRPGAEPDLRALETTLPGISQRTTFLHAPGIEVSSSEIRERVRLGRPYRYLVPEGVWRIIEEEGLYRRS